MCESCAKFPTPKCSNWCANCSPGAVVCCGLRSLYRAFHRDIQKVKSVRPATTTEEAIKQPASVSVVGDPTYHRSCTYTRVHHTHQREEITVCASYLSLTSLTRAHRAHTALQRSASSTSSNRSRPNHRRG